MVLALMVTLVAVLVFPMLMPRALPMPRYLLDQPVAVGPSVVLLFLLLPRGPFAGQGLPAMLIVMPSF